MICFNPQKSTQFADLVSTVNAKLTIYHRHATSHSETLIDNIFTTCASSWASGVLNFKLSDHELEFLRVDSLHNKVRVNSLRNKEVLGEETRVSLLAKKLVENFN